MKKVAQFKRVSFVQFRNDFENIIKNNNIGNINEIYDNIKLPTRATIGSAGYDISIPFDLILSPGETFKIPTGIRCNIKKDYVMLIFPRSSLGVKKGLFIMNTIPVIDSDYYNSDNEGHIFICIKNTSESVMKLNMGENIVQAVFLKYGITYDDNAVQKRDGGFGSTDG